MEDEWMDISKESRHVRKRDREKQTSFYTLLDSWNVLGLQDYNPGNPSLFSPVAGIWILLPLLLCFCCHRRRVISCHVMFY